MHVLFLPSIYPTADEPWRGRGVRDQALALARSGVKVGVAFVERRGLGKLNPATLERLRALYENVPLRRKEVA